MDFKIIQCRKIARWCILCFSFKRRTVTICISHQHEPQVHRPHLSKSCWFVHRKCTQLPLSVAILRPCPRYHHCNKTTYIRIIPNKRNYTRHHIRHIKEHTRDLSVDMCLWEYTKLAAEGWKDIWILNFAKINKNAKIIRNIKKIPIIY